MFGFFSGGWLVKVQTKDPGAIRITNGQQQCKIAKLCVIVYLNFLSHSWPLQKISCSESANVSSHPGDCFGCQNQSNCLNFTFMTLYTEHISVSETPLWESQVRIKKKSWSCSMHSKKRKRGISGILYFFLSLKLKFKQEPFFEKQMLLFYGEIIYLKAPD